MMTSYFAAFLRDNRIKVGMLVVSMGLYYALAVAALSLNRSVPEIAAIPLRSIGVQTVVQKGGKIPSRMLGAVFPHSNGPIPEGEYRRLRELPFVESADQGLYFWYFDTSYFKAVLGVEPGPGILAEILGRNVVEGSFDLGAGSVLVTEGFARKRSLSPGSVVEIGGAEYRVGGTVRASPSGDIIPADIYMGMDDAGRIVRSSREIADTYGIGEEPFSNVVLLRTDPGWQGDREAAVKEIDEELLVFSEKTFSGEIVGQLELISRFGKTIFAVLGVVLTLAFGVMVVFNLKARESEIAILRMIGWRIRDLRRQFMAESLAMLLGALALGNALAVAGLGLLRRQTISMELPWDISARPHFLPEENAIERVVTSGIPVHFEPMLFLAASLAFVLLFAATSQVVFTRIKHVKPSEFQR